MPQHVKLQGTIEVQMCGDKRLWAEEYNRTSKTLRRRWAETLREIKMVKSNKRK